MSMTRETLAEVICNLNGADPNQEEAWAEALQDADQQLEAAAAGEQASWWLPEEEQQ